MYTYGRNLWSATKMLSNTIRREREVDELLSCGKWTE